jgi:hypothetical protein
MHSWGLEELEGWSAASTGMLSTMHHSVEKRFNPCGATLGVGGCYDVRGACAEARVSNHAADDGLWAGVPSMVMAV